MTTPTPTTLVNERAALNSAWLALSRYDSVIVGEPRPEWVRRWKGVIAPRLRELDVLLAEWDAESYEE